MSAEQVKLDTIGSRLRWARLQAGLSQGQVAKLLSVHRPTISQIEAEQRQVRPQEIIAFAEIYSVEELWIIHGTQPDHDGLDAKIEVAARELAKLNKDDFKKVLNVIKVLRSDKGRNSE